MSELLYKEEIFQLVGLCMEIHRELGKGHDEVIYKDALIVELTRAGIPFSREKNYEITYRGSCPASLLLRRFRYLGQNFLEAKAVEKLTDSHIKQVLNYLAASKLRVGLVGQFRRRCVGMETGHFIDANDENRHELPELSRRL